MIMNTRTKARKRMRIDKRAGIDIRLGKWRQWLVLVSVLASRAQ